MSPANASAPRRAHRSRHTRALHHVDDVITECEFTHSKARSSSLGTAIPRCPPSRMHPPRRCLTSLPLSPSGNGVRRAHGPVKRAPSLEEIARARALLSEAPAREPGSSFLVSARSSLLRGLLASTCVNGVPTTRPTKCSFFFSSFRLSLSLSLRLFLSPRSDPIVEIFSRKFLDSRVSRADPSHGRPEETYETILRGRISICGLTRESETGVVFYRGKSLVAIIIHSA